jgi:hypothetical protein
MEILYKLEEKPLREVGDNALITEMDAMNENLQQLPDDYICNMQENQMKRITILQQLYANLAHVHLFVKPALVADVSRRMVQLTLSKGISPTAPVAFALYGEALASIGNISEGYRLGKFIQL